MRQLLLVQIKGLSNLFAEWDAPEESVRASLLSWQPVWTKIVPLILETRSRLHDKYSLTGLILPIWEVARKSSKTTSESLASICLESKMEDRKKRDIPDKEREVEHVQLEPKQSGSASFLEDFCLVLFVLCYFYGKIFKLAVCTFTWSINLGRRNYTYKGQVCFGRPFYLHIK